MLTPQQEQQLREEFTDWYIENYEITNNGEMFIINPTPDDIHLFQVNQFNTLLEERDKELIEKINAENDKISISNHFAGCNEECHNCGEKKSFDIAVEIIKQRNK